MRDHIFAPLGMKDAGFFVPDGEAQPLRHALSRSDPKASWLADRTRQRIWHGDYAEQPTMPSGGGGLVSTAEDYYRFAQMLANGGELDGERILSPPP